MTDPRDNLRQMLDEKRVLSEAANRMDAEAKQERATALVQVLTTVVQPVFRDAAEILREKGYQANISGYELDAKQGSPHAHVAINVDAGNHHPYATLRAHGGKDGAKVTFDLAAGGYASSRPDLELAPEDVTQDKVWKLIEQLVKKLP